MKKNIKSILVFVAAFLIFKAVFSDWENFKAGLSTKPPIIKKK